jgi:Uma2 family endonuclease
VLASPERFRGINHNGYFHGGPDAVVEIRSPDDEAYEKLDYYFKVGVQEVWVIDRDSKRPEICEQAAGGHQQRKADANGWLCSDVVGAEFRASGDGKLEIRMIGRPETAARLP